MRQTVYVIFNDHENPMACRCCRYEGPEYVHEIYADEAMAMRAIKELGEEWKSQGNMVEWGKASTTEDTYDEVKCLGNGEGHVVYRYFIMPMEVLS